MSAEQSNIILDAPEDEVQKPSIYSKRAIWGFSILLSPIFGGVLLMRNMWSIGKKNDAYQVLGFSVIFTIMAVTIVSNMERAPSSLTYIINSVGGFVLTGYFFKKYFADEKSFPKKKIWKPLLISILICIPIILAMLYEQGLI